jgi:DNA-binding response OmpR family regulator
VTAPATSPETERALVLVVERDPHVRDLERFFLNEAGFTVDFAEDGLSALETVRTRKPAIIVTEIIVPGLDGLALCRKVKEDPALAGTVVLVFSILAAHGRARDAGADAFLMKPLAERRLVETVKTLLGNRVPADPRPQTELSR